MQIVLFNTPLPRRMQYVSLKPISLALGDKGLSVNTGPGDEKQETEKAHQEKLLMEKIELHSVSRHIQSVKEYSLHDIIEQV